MSPSRLPLQHQRSRTLRARLGSRHHRRRKTKGTTSSQARSRGFLLKIRNRARQCGLVQTSILPRTVEVHHFVRLCVVADIRRLGLGDLHGRVALEVVQAEVGLVPCELSRVVLAILPGLRASGRRRGRRGDVGRRRARVLENAARPDGRRVRRRARWRRVWLVDLHSRQHEQRA